MEQAHFCVRSPEEILDLLRVGPERVASIVFQGATGNPADFQAVAKQMLWLSGDGGSSATLLAGRLADEPNTNIHWLPGCTELLWSDTVADRSEEVAVAVLNFLARMDQARSPATVALSSQGEVAQVTYKAAGTGTPVVLLPLALAPHQWDALLPPLQAKHCTIVLGGRHLKFVESLESRAASGYSDMVLSLLDLTSPEPHHALIEVGCGTGALLRRIVRRTGIPRVVGLDINAFLLGEARDLAASEGLADRLDLREGSAEAIPCNDNSFDITLCSTVLEEVDADRALAELVRITKPGGRVVVTVRAVDRESCWTNLPISKPLRDLFEGPGPNPGVVERGCADDSLYRRVQAAGLIDVRGGPAFAWDRLGSARFKNREAARLTRLSADQAEEWRAAMMAAEAEGSPIWLTEPFHCAVGVKPEP
ncbi:MAG: methyltransferase domain-containing protein [Chloroflexi bacterium]|nr:methyltransferase domain-containing protein [Chloroflexota bacterium]